MDRQFPYIIKFRKFPKGKIYTWTRFAPNIKQARHGVLKALKSEGWPNAVIESLKRTKWSKLG